MIRAIDLLVDLECPLEVPLCSGHVPFGLQDRAQIGGIDRDPWVIRAVDLLVNLERPLKLGDELGGHLVSGHVDGLATLIARDDMTDMAHLRLRAPHELARFIASKGSVALDGVSLTVNAVDGDSFSVLIIPHTLSVTTLGGLRKDDEVNLEIDTMARYAARLMETR